MSSQPTPTLTHADIQRLVCRDFPAEHIEQVHAMLGEYGTESWHKEVHRVRAAALKLAAGNLETLRSHINVAKMDYRDVLAPAEYSDYCRFVTPGSNVCEADRQRIINSDWKDYQDWFRRT